MCHSDNIDQEIENIGLLDRFSDIFLLQSTAFVELRIVPAPNTQIQNEQLACFCEQDWGFSGYHPDIFVRLHNAFDPCQWQVVMSLEILLCLLSELLDRFNLLFPELIQTAVKSSQKLWRAARWSWGL